LFFVFALIIAAENAFADVVDVVADHSFFQEELFFAELECFDDQEELVDERFTHWADSVEHCKEFFHGENKVFMDYKYRGSEAENFCG